MKAHGYPSFGSRLVRSIATDFAIRINRLLDAFICAPASGWPALVPIPVRSAVAHARARLQR